MLSNSRPTKFDSALRAGLAAMRAGIAVAGRALPMRCVLCTAASGESLLCDGCARALPVTGDACPLCALPVPGSATCGACLRRPPPQARTVAALAYRFPVDRLVLRLKYGHDLALAGALAAILVETVRRQYAGARLPDAVVPLPLAYARQCTRGFNQAAEIARPLARALGLPVVHALARPHHSPVQASLPRARRAANVRHAFDARGLARGMHVALVDDVMTTGATIAAAARTLLAAGAAGVDAWVVARTPAPGTN